VAIMNRYLTAALAAAILMGCAPRPRPIIQQGQTIPDRTEEVVARAHADGQAERARQANAVGAAQADAMATCTGDICAAISRGEIALGMTTTQVLAATRTSTDAWDIRGSEGARVMGPRIGSAAPRDAAGEVAQVSIQDGRVTSYTYRDPQGFRTVASPYDASQQGRAEARAAALLEEGDRAAAVGDMARALDLYDRADVIRPADAATQLRIAQILEQQQRPLEAIMRYQLFIHHMELERIQARGEAAAHMADAIARAQQRIMIIERQR
jgi:tetratricopeptide (TPR) repeat protein